MFLAPFQSTGKVIEAPDWMEQGPSMALQNSFGGVGGRGGAGGGAGGGGGWTLRSFITIVRSAPLQFNSRVT